ncbi:MAG: phage/plasmid replication protein [Bacteroidota bacterium]
MIDTLNLQLNHTQYDYKHIQQIFEDKLEFIADNRFKNGSSTTVHYRNYKFTLSEKSLTATGSLTKLHYGNNVQNLNYSQVQHTLTEFESLFEIPFDDAKIKRIDIAYNMEMDNPVNLYFDLLTTPDHYKLRYFEDETKYYESSKNKLSFYKKIEELRKHDRVSYEKHKHQHILKYEISFTKNLLKNLNLPDITMKNLYNPSVYTSLLDQWYQGYYAVPKLTKMLPSQFNYTTLTTFKESLMIEGIRSIGGVEILNMAINQAVIKKNVKHLIKNYTEGFNQVEPLSPQLQYELDRKIDAAYEYEKAQVQY